jgi:hypothetical protein
MTLGLILSGAVMLAFAAWGLVVWLRRVPEKPGDSDWYEGGQGNSGDSHGGDGGGGH